MKLWFQETFCKVQVGYASQVDSGQLGNPVLAPDFKLGPSWLLFYHASKVDSRELNLCPLTHQTHLRKAQVGSTGNLCMRINPGSPEWNSGRRSNAGSDKDNWRRYQVLLKSLTSVYLTISKNHWKSKIKLVSYMKLCNVIIPLYVHP